jgi:hypothetical protein
MQFIKRFRTNWPVHAPICCCQCRGYHKPYPTRSGSVHCNPTIDNQILPSCSMNGRRSLSPISDWRLSTGERAADDAMLSQYFHNASPPLSVQKVSTGRPVSDLPSRARLSQPQFNRDRGFFHTKRRVRWVVFPYAGFAACGLPCGTACY